MMKESPLLQTRRLTMIRNRWDLRALSPVPCASISRWVPAPERRKRPRPVPSADAEVYRQLLAADASQPKSMRWLKRGALGLTIVSVAGWLWRRSASEASAATAVKTRRPDDGA